MVAQWATGMHWQATARERVTNSMPLVLHPRFASPLFEVAGPKPREKVCATAAVSLRNIPPLRGGEGERSLFPTGTEITSNSTVSPKYAR